MTPEISSVAGLRSGIAAFIGDSFSHGQYAVPIVVEAEMGEPELRLTLASVHTPTMALKNAALLAFVGTIVMTALLAWNFVFTFLNVLRGLVPAASLFSSFIYAFGCFSVMVFFFVFHRAQK